MQSVLSYLNDWSTTVNWRNIVADPLLPLYRARYLADVEWANLNHWAVKKLRTWERTYWTPYEGERIDACMGKDKCIVDRVDIRKRTVWDTDDRRHDLNYCVDPYGWRDAYLDPPTDY